MKRLAIISHTEHFKKPDGIVVGWGSTISEINHLAKHFDVIYHIAFLHPGTPPPSSLPYTSSNIQFVPLQPVGGKGIEAKLKIIRDIPTILNTVRKTLRKVDVFQLRTPTGMGVFLIPYLTLFSNKKGWYKYAGNWQQVNPPLGYALQRLMLKLQKRPVTINGFWPDQPKHCHSFENPCLTQDDILHGKTVSDLKQFEAPFVFTFVGRLEDPKGVSRIIEAFKKVPLNMIKSVHFIGDGKKMEVYKSEASFLKDQVFFHGFLDKTQVHQVLMNTHFLLLPSTASEGFPKVIAEAACYGVIPLVSNVGSIGHYVNSGNGFVWDLKSEARYNSILYDAIHSSKEDLKKRSLQFTSLATAFTFSNYLKKLNETVFIKFS